jgi:hypothetical protein
LFVVKSEVAPVRYAGNNDSKRRDGLKVAKRSKDVENLFNKRGFRFWRGMEPLDVVIPFLVERNSLIVAPGLC